MKIGILGAPGAGKTEFAEKLSRELDGSFLVIDNFTPDLRLRTELAYGLDGSHIDDMQVVFKRREWELYWKSNTISVGTVLDSTAHCFARAESPARNRKDLIVKTERLRAIAEAFGLLYTDTWDYDYAFYLPYKGDDLDSRMIDAALVELLTKYTAPVFSFKAEVPDDEKASTAARAINALEAKQLPEAPERGVRSSSEASEADGGSSEPVPDVPEQGRDSNDA